MADAIVEKILQEQGGVSVMLSGQETNDQIKDLNDKRGFLIKYSKHYKKEQVKQANIAWDEGFSTKLDDVPQNEDHFQLLSKDFLLKTNSQEIFAPPHPELVETNEPSTIRSLKSAMRSRSNTYSTGSVSALRFKNANRSRRVSFSEKITPIPLNLTGQALKSELKSETIKVKEILPFSVSEEEESAPKRSSVSILKKRAHPSIP